MAAHTEALKAGMDEDDAAYAADKLVRTAHGAGGAKVLSAIQRGNGREVLQLFTKFYSFLSRLYNQQGDLARDAARICSMDDFGNVLAHSFFYLVDSPAIHGLIAGSRGREDDDESWSMWAAKHIGLGLVSAVLVVRDVASAIGYGSAYRVTLAADAMDKLKVAATDAARALGMIEGELSDRWV